MGNSEVGHLNLGAGAVVKQDLARIDDAVADGSLFENEALLAACARRPREPARAPAPDGPGLRRRRALRLDPPRGADRARRAGGRPGRRRARVHRRPRHAADLGARATSTSSSAGCATRAGSGPSAAATTRWTATGAGSGPSSPTTRSSTPRASARRRRAEAVAAAHERGETDEFIRPTVIGDYDGVADGDVAIHFNFRPDRARQLVMALAEPDFDEFDRGDAPDIELTTLTRYRADWTYPVAFPPQEPETTLAEVLSEAGDPPAARRRDREVRARHLLLQRRARARVGGGGAPPGRLAARRRHLRRAARDERRGGRRERSSSAGRPTATGSGSSTSPTPTWSGTRAASRPRRGRSRPSTPASARSCARSHESGGACIVTADHGNAEQMLEPDGSPNTAHSLNPVPFVVTVDGARARRRRDPRRRRPHGPRPARHRAAGGDDRALADQALSSRRYSASSRPRLRSSRCSPSAQPRRS